MSNDRKTSAKSLSRRDYLTSEAAKHPEYFSDPFSEDARKYFKKMLEKICESAIKHGTSAGVYQFLQCVRNERTRSLMLTWIETYTPIREIKFKNGMHQFQVVPEYRNRCSLAEAMQHPYFTIQEKQRKIIDQSKEIDKFAPLLSPNSLFFESSRPAKSDFELIVKRAKIAFNEFVRERSIESKAHLIELINEIALGDFKKSGSPFFQGGAPGLGKSKR